MAFKKYFATKDNTITNAFKADLEFRATGSNMGAADSIEVFKIYGQATTSSSELSRALLEFNSTEISSSRDDGKIPASGSVNFFLNLYNARHPFTVPNDFTLLIQPISRSWTEGRGLDMEEYKDDGLSNWLSASSTAAWTTSGGDFHSGSGYNKTAVFTTGVEDLSVDITNIVEDWMSGSLENYGLGVRLSGSAETSTTTYYTKKFFARSSEFFFKRPTIEARWDSSLKDERASFYVSSSLLTSSENLNTIYLYNRFRRDLRNIPAIGTGSIYVKIFDTVAGDNELSSSITVSYPITGGLHETGIYSCSLDLNTTSSTVYDRWFDSTMSTCFFTGAISVKQIAALSNDYKEDYFFKITNLKEEYSRKETNARIKLYTRKKNWSPTIYTVAKTDIENYIIENIYYKIRRTIDNFTIVDYGTGSLNHTLLSYDVSGSYFNFDMSTLESGYTYEYSFLVKEGSNYLEQPQKFKFRVE